MTIETKFPNYITSNIRPTKVSIFYENGEPYLDYTGKLSTTSGEYEVHIPKISLTYTQISMECNHDYELTLERPIPPIQTSFSQTVSVVDDTLYTLKLLKRYVTKAELEKQLGYEIEFKG